jgi:hypothetical protein
MDGDDKGSHDGHGCLGMWRMVEAVLDPDAGALTLYRCELCEALLPVPPGGVHPGTA